MLKEHSDAYKFIPWIVDLTLLYDGDVQSLLNKKEDSKNFKNVNFVLKFIMITENINFQLIFY
jgi:hypothetical protein